MKIGDRIHRALIAAAFAGAMLTPGVGHAQAAPPADATPQLSVVGQTFFFDGANGMRIQLELSGSSIDLEAAAQAAEPSGQGLVPIVVVQAFSPVTDPNVVDEPPLTTPLGSVSTPLHEVATLENDRILIDLTLPASVPTVVPNTIPSSVPSSVPTANVPLPAVSIQPLNLNEPGLYPIEVRVVDIGTVATTLTYIDRTPAEIQSEDQLETSIVVAIREIGPAPTESQLAAARSDLERLVKITDLTDLPLTVMLPPSVIDHLLVDDPDLNRRVTEALAGQTLLGAPSFALEPDAAIGASIADDLQTAWQAGAAKLRTNFPDTTVDSSTMLIDAPTSVDGVALLGAVGMKFAIVPNSVYRVADGQIGDYTDPGLLVQLRSRGADSVPAAIGSPALDLLDEPAADSAPITPTERAIELLAHLTAQQSSPSTDFRSVFLMTPEIQVPDPDVIAAIATITSPETNGVDPSAARPIVFSPVSENAQRTESHIVDGKPVTIEWAVKPVDVIGNRLVHIDAAETAIKGSVSMLPVEDPRRESWVWQVRSAESTSLTDEQAGILIAESLAQAEQLRQAVPPPEPFEFTLTGEDTTLRFQLTNNAGTPLDVMFLLKSDRLIAPPQTAVRLAPNTVTDVPIEVSARSNGSASLQVQVVTPDGLALFAPVQMNGRVTTFGGTGKLITVGALLILASWWLSFLNRRRSASLHQFDEPAPTDLATGDPATSDPVTSDPATGDPVTSDPADSSR